MDFEHFWRTESTGAFGFNLKDNQHSFISRIKHTEFWERTLDGLRKYLETVPLPRGTLVDFSPETKLQVPRIEI